MAHTEQPDANPSPPTGAPTDEKYNVKDRFLSIVDGEYNTDEEKLLDQKYDSLWQPTWMGQSRKWRVATRLFICGLGIALIWLTSLKLATTIASLYVASPTYQEAADQWQKSVDLSRAERVSSEACAIRQMLVCDQILGVDINELVGQAQVARDANAIQLNLMQIQTDLCSTNWENTIVTTSKFLQQDLSLTDIYLTYPNGTTYCSADEVAYLTSLLQDATQEKNDVYRYNTQYARDSDNLVDNTTAQIDARVNYDEQYFDNKTDFLSGVQVNLASIGDVYNDQLDVSIKSIDVPMYNMTNCLSLNSNATCLNGTFTWYNQTKQNIDNGVRAMQTSFYANLNVATAWMYQADSWKNKTMAFINYVISAKADLESIIPWDFYNVDDLPLGYPSPAGLIPTISIPSMPLPPDYLSIGPIGAFNVTFGKIKTNLLNIGTFWQLDVNVNALGFPTFFADYNPPPITLDNASWHQTSDSFLAASRQSLGQINTDVTVNTSGYNASAAESAIQSDLTFSPFSLLTEDFTGNVDLYNAFGALGSILFLLVTADIIWRVWQTIGFLRQYQRMSQIGVPEVDARQFEADKQVPNPTLATYKLVTSPFVIVFIIGVILFIILLALISIYIPMYESYVSGCTQSTNGTLLTHNAYSFAYNYASTPYNDVVSHGIRDYDKNRTDKCEARQTDFDNAQQNAQNAWGQDVYTYDQKQPDLVLYQQCVNRSTLPNDTVFQSLLGRRSPFLDTIEFVRVNNCSAPHNYGNSSQLLDGTLNCSVLPLCTITCSGPNKLVLASSTYDSGCTSEWMFHAGLFRFLVALLIYVSLNISRVLVMTAVIRLAWRTLSTQGFEFRGTCTKLGNIEGFDERLKVELDKAIRSYERGALLMLVFAVLVHIPYIVVLTRYGDVLAHDAQFNN